MADICSDWLTDRATDCCFAVIGRPRHPTTLCSAAKNRFGYNNSPEEGAGNCDLLVDEGLHEATDDLKLRTRHLT